MKKYYVLISLVLFLFASCNKDTTGKAVFWYGKATSDLLIAQGITELKFYVEGSLIGTELADAYFETEPSSW